jgi:Zn-dependent peptidase ImmA (M78 family)
MALRPEHFISDTVLEARADALLAAYGRKYGYVDRLPIPLDELVEYHLDLTFDCRVIPDSTAEIPAALDYLGRAIYINDLARPLFNQFPGLERYSIAHEVGHWELHVDHAVLGQLSLFEREGTEPLLCRHQDRSRREVQAEKFAAYLLMPRDLVLQAVSGRTLTAWPQIYELAHEMGVSITALRIRLSDLGLVFVHADGSLSRSRPGQNSFDHSG